MKVKKKIRKIVALTIFVISPFTLFAQAISIGTGANVKVSGAALIRIDNANFINNGAYTKGSETVTLSGNTAREMLGSSTTSLHNLAITNTGGITTKLSQLTANALTIATGSKFTIDTVKAVTVNTTITNNAGASGLLIKSSSNRANGSLIFRNANESAVQATVEMYSKATKVLTSFKWQFFGIPVRTLAKDPTFEDGVNYVRKFNEAGWHSGFADTCHWVQLRNGANLSPFTGYEVTQTLAKSYSFQGELVNSNYDSGPLAFSTGKQYPGQHLIGNPYTAAINISDIEFGTTDVAVMENSVYLYNTGSLADWTTAGSGNSTSVTESSTAGQYIVIPKLVSGRAPGLPGQIPSMQAFLVKVKKQDPLGWVKITYPVNEAGTTLVKNTTLQRAPKADLTCTRIDVKGASFGDRMWIFTEPTCSKAFDNGWDGYKQERIGTAAPSLFAKEVSGDYQINTVDNIHNSLIGFMAGTGSDYTFTFTHQNIETTYNNLYLFDSYTGNYVDITESGTRYSFTSSNTVASESRFKIVTKMEVNTQAASLLDKGFKLYSSKKTIFIQNPTALNGVVQLYDLAGRKVQVIRFNEYSTTTLPLSIAEGTYIAKLQTINDKVTMTLLIR